MKRHMPKSLLPSMVDDDTKTTPHLVQVTAKDIRHYLLVLPETVSVRTAAIRPGLVP